MPLTADSGNTDTPTAPRWTVDDGVALFARPGVGYQFFDLPDDAHAALVRCVRSDATLTRARELAARVKRNRAKGRRYWPEAKADAEALLDLLTEAPDGVR